MRSVLTFWRARANSQAVKLQFSGGGFQIDQSIDRLTRAVKCNFTIRWLERFNHGIVCLLAMNMNWQLEILSAVQQVAVAADGRLTHVPRFINSKL